MGAVGVADLEAWVLSTESGLALLAEVAAVATPRPADLVRWRRWATAEQVAAALRLAEGRRRGGRKFARAGAMWFDPVGLEQATAEAVARHKAARFAGVTTVDLCCGVGGDALALGATADAVVAVDLDHGMARRTAWNAEVYEVAARVQAVRARAEEFPLPAGAFVHVDPDRRARGATRSKAVEGYEPGLSFLYALTRAAPGGAIKLGPASDFATAFPGPGFEVELTSLDGECKEATVWFGPLATARRRATRLPEGATWTDRDGPADARAGVRAVGPWVFDPDPALVRSGLLDGFAAAHGLGRFAPAVDYLTADARVVSPFLAAFEVVDVLPLDLKILKRRLAGLGAGALEIKVRGADVRPESLRARLKPEGPAAVTLLIAGGPGATARVVMARRVGRVQGAQGWGGVR